MSPTTEAIAAVASPGKSRGASRRSRSRAAASRPGSRGLYRTSPVRPSSSGSGWGSTSAPDLSLRRQPRAAGWGRGQGGAGAARGGGRWEAGAQDQWVPIPTSMPTWSADADEVAVLGGAEDFDNGLPATTFYPTAHDLPLGDPVPQADQPPPQQPEPEPEPAARRRAVPTPEPTPEPAALAASADEGGSLTEQVSAVMGHFFSQESESEAVGALRNTVLAGDGESLQAVLAESGGPALLLQGRPPPLALAATRGDVAMVRTITMLGGRAVWEGRTLTGGTALHAAAACGHAEVCAALLEAHPRGVDLLSTSDGASALHLACRLGRTAAAELLLSRGANPRRADDRVGTALHHAARGGGPGREGGSRQAALKLLATLIQHGCEVNDARGVAPATAADKERERQRRRAAMMGEKEKQQAALLERPVLVGDGGKPGAEEGGGGAEEGGDGVKRGWTALHHAVQCSQWRLAASLVFAGADPMAKDSDGLTPLRVAPLPLSGVAVAEAETSHRIESGAALEGLVEQQPEEEMDDDAKNEAAETAAAAASRRGLYGEEVAWAPVDSAAAALRLGAQLRNLREQEEEAPPPQGLTEEEKQATFSAMYERYFGAYFKAGDEGAEARARLAAIQAKPRRTPLSPRVEEGRKFALVIANGRYQHSGSVGGVNVDAEQMSAVLAAHGWAVQRVHDATASALTGAVSAFIANITGGGGGGGAGAGAVGGRPQSVGPPLPSWARGASFTATGARPSTSGGGGGGGKGKSRRGVSRVHSAASFSRRSPGVRSATAPAWTESLLLPEGPPARRRRASSARSCLSVGGSFAAQGAFSPSRTPPKPADIFVWFAGAAACVSGRNILVPTDAAAADALLSSSQRRPSLRCPLTASIDCC